MRIQTALSDKLKKHSYHHASIPDWMHDCAEWDDCNILIEKIEQKNKQRIKEEENMDADKITLSSYIVYLQSMYKRYGDISIAQLKTIERNRKRR